jgi:hypothetical protein
MGWRLGQWWSWTCNSIVCQNSTSNKGYGGTRFCNWNNLAIKDGEQSWVQHSTNDINPYKNEDVKGVGWICDSGWTRQLR